MDESDFERAQNHEGMMMAATLGRIQRSVNAGFRITGECEDCGNDIPAKRLNALPGARRCVECQETHERPN